MKNREKTKNGFTIIEILIVIAVISVIAGIVLSNVTNYSNKSKDAKIKAQLAEIQKNGVIYFGNFGTYNPPGPDAFCDDSVTARIFESIVSTQKNCNDSANQWRVCAIINIPSDESVAWCVDSTGNKKGITNNQCNNSSSPCP